VGSTATQQRQSDSSDAVGVPFYAVGAQRARWRGLGHPAAWQAAAADELGVTRFQVSVSVTL
jgi:hypothetical protein